MQAKNMGSLLTVLSAPLIDLLVHLKAMQFAPGFRGDYFPYVKNEERHGKCF